MSEIENIIPPEIKNDKFYFLIQRLARELPVQTVLEIGSSAGGGSTEAFVTGLKDNPNAPKLFCLEVSKPRHKELSARYAEFPFVRTYNASSISTDKFLSAAEVREFHSKYITTLNQYPVERVLGWLEQDLAYVRESGSPQNGIEIVKRENGIEFFDLVLIDGSAFTGNGELDQVYGAGYILLDDVNDIKCLQPYLRLRSDPQYELIEEDILLRNGYAAFRKKKFLGNPRTATSSAKATSSSSSALGASAQTSLEPKHKCQADLPLEIFTIVINGQPFIRHHVEVFSQLGIPWHWHIIEGIAELKHDTAWSLKTGGAVPAALHREGLSIDGTTEYIDQLKARFPDNISVYRKPPGQFWEGKLEMVSQPLSKITQESLLLQIDVDELWTVEQLQRLQTLFKENPEKSSAFFMCRYFVGEHLVITSRETLGNHSSFEWQRAWRFRPGCLWAAHEPPTLAIQDKNGAWIDYGRQNPFLHAQTEAAGLVFDHFAYATLPQIQFKESYYGYKGAVAEWQTLQTAKKFPLLLKNYFSWVTDETTVDTIFSQHIKPIARSNAAGDWKFRAHDDSPENPAQVLFVRTDSIGDNVIAMGMLPQIRWRYPGAQITVTCQEHIASLYRACPEVDRIISYDQGRLAGEDVYRTHIIEKLQNVRFDISLNSVFSPIVITHLLALGCTAQKRIGMRGNLNNIKAEEREHFSSLYSLTVNSIEGQRIELDYHQDFLKALGIENPEKPFPKIWIPEQDEAYADTFFKRQHWDPKKTIALFCGAQQQFKFYEGFGAALRELVQKEGYSIVALGGTSDLEINQKNIERLGVPVQNLSGQTSLLEAAAIIKRCRIAVGADTSHAHIAAAVGTPHVVLLGGGHFGRFLPYSALSSVVCLPLECFQCNWHCGFRKHHCIKDVAPEVITEAVRQTLAASSDKPRIFYQTLVPVQEVAPVPRLKSIEALIPAERVHLIPVAVEPRFTAITANARPEKSEKGISSRAVATFVSEEQEDFWLPCQILKERCEESPGIVLVGHGGVLPTPEVLRGLEKHNYYVISTTMSRDDLTAWSNQPRCLGSLLNSAAVLEKARAEQPEKIFERLNCVMLNFFRTVTQQPSWMATLAGSAYNAPLPAQLKTLDFSSCWTSVPLKRTELVVESALQGNYRAYLISQEYGTREEIVHTVQALATRYQKQTQVFFMPFEPYALQQIGEGLVIDGRPIGLNNGIVASIIDKSFVYLHTSESEGVPNSVVEALMRNVPVLVCNDVLGPLTNIAHEIEPCISVCDPNPAAIVEAVQKMKSNYKDFEDVSKIFRAQFDPFEVNRRLVRHCQALFAKSGIAWKGHWQGLTNGTCALFNLAKDIPGWEQALGQKPVYPNLDLTLKYMSYQMGLAKQAENIGALELLEVERDLLLKEWSKNNPNKPLKAECEVICVEDQLPTHRASLERTILASVR